MTRLSRRRFLRGAGGAAIALPFLGAMDGPAKAAPFPKRFVVFFTGLGQVKQSWLPSGSGADFTLGEVLAPLEPFKSKIMVLDGVDMESAHHGPGDPHQLGIGHALTGTELQEGTLFPHVCDPDKTVGWGGGVSIDQLLAQQIGQTTKLGSLELGVQVQYSNVSASISYRAPGVPVPPEDDPAKVFDRLFTDLAANPRVRAFMSRRRHRVLDAVMEDYAALDQRLGGEDRQKLEQHLDSIRDVALRLDAPGALGGICALPDLGDVPATYDNDAYPVLGKLQMDLLAMALACDLTRVASLQWTTVQTGKVFSWLGQTQIHHELSHAGGSDPVARAQLVDIGRWHAEQLAYLLSKLAAMPEGDGTVLDNTVLLWCTDIAEGHTHARRDMPYLIAGDAGGYYQSGRVVSYQGAWHNDLLVSLCRAMGVGVSTFGNPAYCTGELPGLTS